MQGPSLGDLLGANTPRIEGDKFVTGRVAYSADLVPPNALHLAVLRSPHPRATIRAVDLDAALKFPGVIAALTGEQAEALAGPMPPAMDSIYVRADRGPLQSRCLATRETAYVGQPVAAIVAESIQAAQAALAHIRVLYEVLNPVMDAEEAIKDGAGAAQPGWTTNVLCHDIITAGDARGAFARADHVVQGTMTIGTSTSAPIETLCFIGDWDERSRRMTVTGTFQNPHSSRWLLSVALGLSETDVRIVAPRIGGTFGLKMAGHPEELLVAVLSRLTRRPVAYIEERSECLHAGSRSQIHRFEIAATKDGKVIAFRDRILADVGILGAGRSWAMALTTPSVFPTVYDIPNCDIEFTLAITNHSPWQAIRGYGKEIANLVMERAMELLARELKMDPVTLRTKNLVPPEALPRLLPSGHNVDSGDYPGALQQLLDLFGYDHWRARQSSHRSNHTRLGISVALELTPEGGARPGNFPSGYETATVRLMPSGDIQVATGVTSPGSGSDTGIAQMVAGQLGLEPRQVRVIEGDTDATPVGTGNASSRALMYGGTAAYLAAKDLRDRLTHCASNLLACEASLIDLERGLAVRRDNQQSISVAQIALAVHTHPFTAAAGVTLPLEITRSFSPGNVRVTPDARGRLGTYPTFSYSVHAVALELDIETGIAQLLDYAVVHDCGTMINPALVEGQLRGAIVMGIGSALWEELKYDSSNALMSNRFKTYLLPRSSDLPEIRLGHRVTPNPFHPLGMKGAGESGLGGALSAVTNAVADALDGSPVEYVPMAPPRVLAALQRGSL